MTREKIRELADRVVKYYKSIVSEDQWRLAVFTILELAKGEPVEPVRLAELMDERVEKTETGCKTSLSGMNTDALWGMA